MDFSLLPIELPIEITTSVWVAFDAHKHQITIRNKSYSRNVEVSAWFFGCLTLWIVVFPYYLIRRSKLLSLRRGGTPLPQNIDSRPGIDLTILTRWTKRGAVTGAVLIILYAVGPGRGPGFDWGSMIFFGPIIAAGGAVVGALLVALIGTVISGVCRRD